MLSVLTFRTPDEAVEKANNTPYGLSAGVWTEKGSRILAMAQQLRAGVIWANTYNRFDPASPFGGYKESGFGREGGRHGLEPYLEFESRARLPVKKTYKLYIGGAFPRSRVGAHLRGGGRRTSRAPPARTSATPSAPRAARSPSWAAMTAYNRGQVLYRIAEMLEARRAEFAELCSRPRRGRALDRPPRLVRRLGRQAAAGARRRRTRSPARTSTSPCPSRPASSASSRPTSRRCSGSSRASRPRSSAGTPSSSVASETRPLAAIELAEALATARRPRRRRQPAHRAPRRARAVARLAHGRQRDRPRRRRRPGAPSSSGSRRRTSSASSAAAPTCRARGRSPPSSSSRPSGTRSASSCDAPFMSGQRRFSQAISEGDGISVDRRRRGTPTRPSGRGAGGGGARRRRDPAGVRERDARCRSSGARAPARRSSGRARMP